MSPGKVTAAGAGAERPEAVGSRSGVPAALGELDFTVSLRHWTGRAVVVAEVEVEADPFLGPATDWSLRCFPPLAPVG